MKNRCIMIVPNFDNGNIIDEIREKYDRNAHRVRPHITLVFPFESDIGERELRCHLSMALSGMKRFPMTLQGVQKMDSSSGYYLYVEVKAGSEEIQCMHRALYGGLLQSFMPEWLQNMAFMPHMTIGQFDDNAGLIQAYQNVFPLNEVFHTIVEKIAVEIIGEEEMSVTEMVIGLDSD